MSPPPFPLASTAVELASTTVESISVEPVVVKPNAHNFDGPDFNGTDFDTRNFEYDLNAGALHDTEFNSDIVLSAEPDQTILDDTQASIVHPFERTDIENPDAQSTEDYSVQTYDAANELNPYDTGLYDDEDIYQSDRYDLDGDIQISM